MASIKFDYYDIERNALPYLHETGYQLQKIKETFDMMSMPKEFESSGYLHNFEASNQKMMNEIKEIINWIELTHRTFIQNTDTLKMELDHIDHKKIAVRETIFH